MWVPNGEALVLAFCVVFGVLSAVGFVVLARQARREGGRR